ncbi:virion structural protein [Pseudomonas phage Psa21]|uniref:Virion structural protein n=1 Tax=Pseudomonas phage Psa21 TaxID=2530023 RepID=A0A481W4G0_9CAUD|nr:virion structural protein [Pseudomonas phage Psa21]QBJ02630.1 virion structural protein [Pseudomonas phage Psa21]
MVGATNAIAPETPKSVDGVEPVDMIASLESQFDSLEERTEATLRKLAQSLSFGVALEAQRLDPDETMFQYALEKFEDVAPGEYLSFEDISNSSKKVWDKSVESLKQLQNETIEYARVINIGSDRLVERTNMLYEQAQTVKGNAYKKEFTLKSPKKFNIDGRYEPKDITRIISLANSAFAFHDKVFLKFMDTVSRIFDKLSFDHDFTDEAGVDFSPFVPTTWMAKAEPVEKDDRFRVAAPLFKTPAIQGNKALYASGPTEAKTDEIMNWAFMVNTVRDFSFRYYTVRELKPANQEALIVEVDQINNIRQRLSQLLAISKRFQSRKGYESKLAQALRKIQISGEKIRTKAGQFKVEADPTDKEQVKETPIKGRPAISDIIQSITLMINNVSRMVTDYNNAMAGIIRTLGGLTYVAELELKAYQPPLRKPTPNEIEGKPNETP